MEEIKKAVENVFESYKKDIENIDKEQVLIQAQTENVMISGVIFTRDINYNRPFYLINYDDNGSTDSVTSGSGGKSLYISYDSKKEELPEIWKRLIESVKEIQNLLKGLVLDIEFAVNDKEEVIIFQVRPLAANYKFKDNLDDDEKFFELKNKNRNKYLTLENMFEENNIILSDMAFWNPSEIIGSNSKPLDYSLYREIITSSSWNKGLVPLGYKEADKDLMHKLGNKPYISVDDSFYSLIPNQISENISKKLVEFYKEKLKKNLKLHDKIEFEIVLSCYDFNTENSLNELLKNGFSNREILEIKGALFNLTKESMNNYFKILKKDLKDLDELKKVREKIENKLEKKDYIFYIESIKELLDSLNNYGTPHFSRQARYAFIAKSICKSLIDNRYASEEEIEEFMLSIRTIATEFKEDFDLYLNGELSRKEFDSKYGHLRSGTYDIRTDRYDKLEFNISKKEIQKKSYKEEKIVDFSFKNKLKDLNFEIEPEEFIEILRKCIENREYFKYEFTKSLSLVIEIIILLGKALEIPRNSLSYLEINDIYSIELYNKKKKQKNLPN
ncbi:Pyruvate phosphate dikinase, PEP/pyruvate binding domain [Fusobacterium varium]|nr:Pyruvate phosphate dikinase, PEP/pyruvate binding domain [Fusobacterium varium]